MNATGTDMSEEWHQKNPVLKFVFSGRMPNKWNISSVCAGTMQNWSSVAKDKLMVAENAETCAAQAVELCRLKREGKEATLAKAWSECGMQCPSNVRLKAQKK